MNPQLASDVWRHLNRDGFIRESETCENLAAVQRVTKGPILTNRAVDHNKTNIGRGCAYSQPGLRAFRIILTITRATACSPHYHPEGEVSTGASKQGPGDSFYLKTIRLLNSHQ